MKDFFLVVARQLAWDEKTCREQPAFRAMVIRFLEEIVSNEEEEPVVRAEAAMLIRKLKSVGY